MPMAVVDNLLYYSQPHATIKETIVMSFFVWKQFGYVKKQEKQMKFNQQNNH